MRAIFLGLQRLIVEARIRCRDDLTLGGRSTKRDLEETIARHEKTLDIEIETLPCGSSRTERGILKGIGPGAA